MAPTFTSYLGSKSGVGVLGNVEAAIGFDRDGRPFILTAFTFKDFTNLGIPFTQQTKQKFQVQEIKGVTTLTEIEHQNSLASGDAVIKDVSPLPLDPFFDDLPDFEPPDEVILFDGTDNFFTADTIGTTGEIEGSKDLEGGSSGGNAVLLTVDEFLRCAELEAINDDGDYFGTNVNPIIVKDENGDTLEIIGVNGITNDGTNEIFADGFESGDTSAWSSPIPLTGAPVPIPQAQPKGAGAPRTNLWTWVFGRTLRQESVIDAGIFVTPGCQLDRASALDRDGNIIVVGVTDTEIPTSPGAIQSTYGGGGSDGFILKWQPEYLTLPAEGIIGAADFGAGPIPPGGFVSVFAPLVGPEQMVPLELDEDGKVRGELARTRVLFDGREGSIVFTSRTQANAIAPFGIAGQETTQIRIEYQGRISEPVVMPVAPTRPAIFALSGTGVGQGAILNQDFSVNGDGNAAARGSFVSIFMTGGGETNPAAVDGELVGFEEPLPRLIAGVELRIGGMEGTVFYAGGAPGLAHGVVQVTGEVPGGAPVGPDVPVDVTIGGVTSQDGITMAVGE